MSWYRDPELFIYCWNSSQGYSVTRIAKKYNVPLQEGDIKYLEALDFSKHLSLGSNKVCDYDALKSILAKNSYEHNREKIMFLNSQGLVIYWDWSRSTVTWSRVDEHDLIFYSLPGIKTNPSVTVLAEKLQAEISNLKDRFNNDVSNLKQELNQEKNYRQALEKRVIDLSIKLQKSRGAGDGSADAEPWMRGSTVPSNWLPFDELDVKTIPRDTPLMLTEGPAVPEFGEDAATNVQANHFCQGSFPIVVVKVEDLIPNNGKARFDPDIWCSINSAGKLYAVRKPSVSDIAFDQHMG